MNLRRRYRLTFEDRARLQSVGELERPLWKWLLGVLLLLLAIFFICGTIIFATPLKRLMPGWLPDGERSSTISNLMRLDSLELAYAQNKSYLDNLLQVLDTRREPTDSTKLMVNHNIASADSLLPASPSEQNFVRMMQERERYNISILAPLAAEDMIFTVPAPGCILKSESRDSQRAMIILPKGSAMGTVADGTVVSVNYSAPEGGFAVIVQHNNGFLSRYSRLSRAVVRAGQHVESGQALGFPHSGGRSLPVLEIWRNGDALIPSEIIPWGGV